MRKNIWYGLEFQKQIVTKDSTSLIADWMISGKPVAFRCTFPLNFEFAIIESAFQSVFPFS